MLCLSQYSHGLAPVDITQLQQPLNLVEHIEIYVDESQQFGLEKLLSSADIVFKKTENKRLNFGYTQSHYWIRFALSNSSSASQKAIIEIAYPLLDRLTLYDPTNDVYTQQTTGDTQPFTARKIKVNTFVFELHMQPYSTKTYYMEVATPGVMFIPITLHSANGYNEALYNHMLLTMLFYGALVGLFFYNLFIAFGTRSKTTFIYCLLIAGNFLLAASLDSHAFRFWPEQIKWQSIAVYAFIYICTLLILSFSRSFLLIDKEKPEYKKYIDANIALALVLSPTLYFLPAAQAGRIAIATTALCCVLLLVLGGKRW